MAPDPTPLRNISDTALWTAAFRAVESERPDALFHDPFARRLADDRGEAIRRHMAAAQDNDWAFIIRTYQFDAAIRGRVAAGIDTVANLAAGLDARPYRMDLPPDLRWVEIDMPDLIAYKEAVLSVDQPRCRLERMALDLADPALRRAAFARIGKGLAITEGLLVYLADEDAAQLGRDLAAAGFDYWLLDLASPALLRYLQSTTGRHTAAAGAPLRFAPREGVRWFEPLGWRALTVDSVFDRAMALGRVPKELLSAPPPPPGPDGPIWSGAILLERS